MEKERKSGRRLPPLPTLLAPHEVKGLAKALVLLMTGVEVDRHGGRSMLNVDLGVEDREDGQFEISYIMVRPYIDDIPVLTLYSTSYLVKTDAGEPKRYKRLQGLYADARRIISNLNELRDGRVILSLSFFDHKQKKAFDEWTAEHQKEIERVLGRKLKGQKD